MSDHHDSRNLIPEAEPKACELCGRDFMGHARQRYCSEKCSRTVRRKSGKRVEKRRPNRRQM